MYKVHKKLILLEIGKRINYLEIFCLVSVLWLIENTYHLWQINEYDQMMSDTLTYHKVSDRAGPTGGVVGVVTTPQYYENFFFTWPKPQEKIVIMSYSTKLPLTTPQSFHSRASPVIARNHLFASLFRLLQSYDVYLSTIMLVRLNTSTRCNFPWHWEKSEWVQIHNL